jgi:integrase
MLTDLAIRSAKPREKSFKIVDSHGLYVEVRPGGSKLWRYRYRIAGKENLFAMGQYPAKSVPPTETETETTTRIQSGVLTLMEARAERIKARALVKQGIHPARERRNAVIRRSWDNKKTFQSVAEAWIAENGKDWADKYLYNIKQQLAKDTYPYIGRTPIGDIKPAHILDILERVKSRSPYMAKTLKIWLSGIFRFAIVRLLVDDDPTFPLKGLIKTPKVTHHPHLDTKDVGPFLCAMDSDDTWYATRAACQILWLTLVRTNEVINSRWEEFDLDGKLWRIPAKRMKMREDHIVPLSRQALDILNSLKAVGNAEGLVFRSHLGRDKPIGYAAVRNVFRRIHSKLNLAVNFTPHGIRSTFSTMANNAGIRPDVIETSLAHIEQNASRRAYNHSTQLPERTVLMQRWADMLDELRAGKSPTMLAA